MLTIWKKLRNRFGKKERTEFKVFLLIKFSGLCLLKNYNNRDVLLDTNTKREILQSLQAQVLRLQSTLNKTLPVPPSTTLSAPCLSERTS